MKIEEVRKLAPLDRFCYWVRERHNIFLRRRAGKERPWTDDVILQNYFFTNPYRENDKVTTWFRENIREPLRNRPEVLFATVAFRWFNYIPTGKSLKSFTVGKPTSKFGMFERWHPSMVVKVLGGLRESGNQIFTGAFMINSPAGEPKLEAIVRRITTVWEDRKQLLGFFTDRRNWEGEHLSLKEAHGALMRYDGMGGFMAYEVVCDLRYTHLLENAADKLKWSNPGPGAVRGLCRLLGIDFEKGRNAHGFTPKVKFDFQEECRKLLAIVRRRLPKMPTFELREIEHSLCESDKYERLLWNDGRAKRRYAGV